MKKFLFKKKYHLKSTLTTSLIPLILFCIVTLLSPVVYCGEISNFPITITDDANRTITFKKPAKRVIPLVTWSYEPLRLLGADDMIVGVTSSGQKILPLSTTKDKPIAGNWKEQDCEKIIELQPDVVITHRPAIAQNLENNIPGIKVVVLDFSNHENFEKDLALLSKILDEEGKAVEFIEWRKKQLDEIQSKIKSLNSKNKLRIYCEWNRPWYTGAGQSPVDTFINMAGGKNIAHDIKSRFVTLEPEWVFKENPQMVVYVPSDQTGYDVDSDALVKEKLESLYVRDGLKGTAAIKGKAVYALDDACCMSATRDFIGLLYLSKWLYPDILGNLDPESIHKEYFEKWLDMPFNGIWVYQ